jgi:gamma-glutamyltranspeptidase/glutathione hydrolase
VRTEALLTDPYLSERARIVSPHRATAPNPGRPEMHATVYLAAADADGMMVSLIQSNFRGFGSGVVVQGTGIALNNRGSGFVLDAKHPNVVGPRKRPLHTIIPGFATKDGKPVAAFGVMGGPMQPQGHVQVALRLFAAGQNPQAAIDAPRWRVEDGAVMLDTAWDSAFRDGLRQRGHALIDGTPIDFGASQILWRLGTDGYVAASESRRDGQAVGF